MKSTHNLLCALIGSSFAFYLSLHRFQSQKREIVLLAYFVSEYRQRCRQTDGQTGRKKGRQTDGEEGREGGGEGNSTNRGK